MAGVTRQEGPIRICGLIPVYNSPMTLERVVSRVQAYLDTVVIVDDGSTDDTRSIADNIAAGFNGLDSPNIEANRGIKL